MPVSQSKSVIIHEFRIEDTLLSGTWLIVGAPGRGKTTFIENLSYYLKHRYPVGRVFIGTPDGYSRMCSIFHPLYVSNYYNDDEEKHHIKRQIICNSENGKGYIGNYAINIMDDISDDNSIFKTKTMIGLTKHGSQHWSQLCLFGSQYAIDFGPGMRKSFSYVAMFYEDSPEELKKLYQNFGGIAGSRQNFDKLMEELTGDYTCIIFKKLTSSTTLEDNVFYYKTIPLNDHIGNWKFGCKEYREWGEERYNKNYKEEIDI
ncbi:hypothetical protein OAG24_00385 [bacterium]|nr:hypothetical protein [bacterium]